MDQFKVALSADDEVVAEVVREHAPRFAAHGYELTQVSLEKSNVLRAFPAFRFENKRTQLRIIVSFNASEQGSSGGFIVLIVSPKNVKLDVEDYLVLHGREELAKTFSYRGSETDVRSYAKAFFGALCDLMDTDLKPIIQGKAFEATPIDWMGYR